MSYIWMSVAEYTLIKTWLKLKFIYSEKATKFVLASRQKSKIFFFKLMWPSRNIRTLWIWNKPEAFLVISVDCFEQVHKLEHTISFGEIGEFLKMLLNQLPNWFWFDSFQHNFWQKLVKSNFFFKVFNVGFFVQCVL